MASVEVGEAGGLSDDSLHFQFHHIQTFVDFLQPLSHYKLIEQHLNQLSQQGHYDPFSGGMRYLEHNAHQTRVEQGRRVWQSIHTAPLPPTPPSTPSDGEMPCPVAKDKAAYSPSGQDFVEQLIVGLGWRVTAEHVGVRTRSLLVTSSDARGVKFVVTSLLDKDANWGCGPEATTPKDYTDIKYVTRKDSITQEGAVEEDGEDDGVGGELYHHFDACNITRFLAAHGGRQGFAVLGFEVGEGECDKIFERYKAKFPEQLVSKSGVMTYKDTRLIEGKRRVRIDMGRMRVLDVFAYPGGDGEGGDHGTVLRFVERTGTFEGRPGFANPGGVLPGLCDVNPIFDGTSIPAYSDHWVSNVLDREGFLQTLQQTLGFAPKVDFNAGVIAAGDAIIESTVIGNMAAKVMSRKEALSNQCQVYLPVNNALSSHGHVASFIRELGQGVQHIASRVDDLISFVERVNNYRSMTSGGFAFLNIPRSYYGVLSQESLLRHGCSQELAQDTMEALQQAGLSSSCGVIDLDITLQQIASLPVAERSQAEFEAKVDIVGKAVLESRYANLKGLLGERLSEDRYAQIVRNRILVDIQGQDILYQIFTCNVLQRKSGEEAPFLEFIQRVCSVCDRDETCSVPIKAGCGGFGIRNFLTLFLSIEVSKAMAQIQAAADLGDTRGEKHAREKVALLTRQMNESNPILNEISEAMNQEGDASDKLVAPLVNAEQRAALERDTELAREKKRDATSRLQGLSDEYARRMRSLEDRHQSSQGN